MRNTRFPKVNIIDSRAVGRKLMHQTCAQRDKWQPQPRRTLSVKDLSTPAQEYALCMFPTNCIFDSDAWQVGLVEKKVTVAGPFEP